MIAETSNSTPNLPSASIVNTCTPTPPIDSKDVQMVQPPSKLPPRITLESSDEKKFVVDRVLFSSCSKIVSMMLDDYDQKDIEGEVVIPITTITGDILQKIIEYMEWHHAHPFVQADAEMENESKDKVPSTFICEWDLKFLEMDWPKIFDLLMAVNWLDYTNLFNVLTQHIANTVKGKSTEEIRTTFNIVNDFTPEEEEQIKKENEWCEED